MAQSLLETLEQKARPAVLFDKLEGAKVQCHACAHRCTILPGQQGICRIRFNRSGILYAPHGYVAGLHCDPIEKKPFFHAYPGALAMSFGMLGCNFHCLFCQNWISSQALRDPRAGTDVEEVTAADIVNTAVKAGCKIVTSTYNEPLMTSEWAVEIFKLAKAQGLITSYVSNGHATPEVVEYLQPWLDLFKVDLKAFTEDHYKMLGGVLERTLDTIRLLHQRGFWVEIVTLVVTGFNDSVEELGDIARFIAGVSHDIPWHVTAFHPDYKMIDPEYTNTASLLNAVKIGKAEGLHFVYAGNLPGAVGNLENTYCPSCRSLLVERRGFRIRSNKLQNGGCPQCRSRIPGRWET